MLGVYSNPGILFYNNACYGACHAEIRCLTMLVRMSGMHCYFDADNALDR